MLRLSRARKGSDTLFMGAKLVRDLGLGEYRSCLLIAGCGERGPSA
jgi:hypothetical protein